MLYHLARHPDVQDKIYQEFLEVAGKDGNITSFNIGKLSYLKACLKESMRYRNLRLGLATINPHIQKVHTKLYKILRFGVNRPNIKRDKAI